MAERPRVVLDTNIFLAAFLSKNPSSPTREILERWGQGEFDLLISPATLREVTGKLLEKKIARERVVDFLALLQRLAILVELAPENPQPVIADDPDDDHILACAVAGKADYLVTHDRHFEPLGESYQSIRISKSLPFLWALRGDQPPEARR